MAYTIYFYLSMALLSVIQMVDSQPPDHPPQQAHGGPPASGHVSEGGSHDEHDWRAGAQNAEHIMEHLDGVMNKSTSDMSEQELQFYYFKLHDYDNNNRLDGLELTKAITHFHGGDSHHDKKPFSDYDIADTVDLMLRDDVNGDGFIDYTEFKSAQEQRRRKNKNYQQQRKMNTAA